LTVNYRHFSLQIKGLVRHHLIGFLPFNITLGQLKLEKVRISNLHLCNAYDYCATCKMDEKQFPQPRITSLHAKDLITTNTQNIANRFRFAVTNSDTGANCGFSSSILIIVQPI